MPFSFFLVLVLHFPGFFSLCGDSFASFFGLCSLSFHGFGGGILCIFKCLSTCFFLFFRVFVGAFFVVPQVTSKTSVFIFFHLTRAFSGDK